MKGITMKMPDGFRIIEADITHINEIAANNRQSVFEQEGIKVSEEQAIRGVEQAISYPNSKYFVLLNSENRVVAQYKQVRAWNDLISRPMIWIERMFVRDEYRGQGLAKLLAEHVAETTRPECGPPLPWLISMINRGNTKSIELAKSSGWTMLDQFCLMADKKSTDEIIPEKEEG